jgi:propanol-preferring alcohol dehydrogenase
MRAWIVDTPGPMASRPLRRVELLEPEPAAGEIRIRGLGLRCLPN